MLVPRRRGQHILLTAGEVNLTLPKEQGDLLATSQKPFLRVLPFQVFNATPRFLGLRLQQIDPSWFFCLIRYYVCLFSLEVLTFAKRISAPVRKYQGLAHPCGFLDFVINLGRLQLRASWKMALLGSQSELFERPFMQPDGQWTLAVSACFGQLAAFEDRTNRFSEWDPVRYVWLAPRLGQVGNVDVFQIVVVYALSGCQVFVEGLGSPESGICSWWNKLVGDFVCQDCWTTSLWDLSLQAQRRCDPKHGAAEQQAFHAEKCWFDGIFWNQARFNVLWTGRHVVPKAWKRVRRRMKGSTVTWCKARLAYVVHGCLPSLPLESREKNKKVPRHPKQQEKSIPKWFPDELPKSTRANKKCSR